jgi:TatD DNase family protein
LTSRESYAIFYNIGTFPVPYYLLGRKAMQFFDTHAHIGLIYDDPIEQLRVIQQAKQAGVTRIVSINNSLHDFTREYNNLKVVPGIYHAVGVAPSEVTNPGKDFASTIEENLKLPNVVAVGETGLDYFKQFGNKRTQIELFITQLEIARKHNLPVIIHNRDAGKDVFDVLSERIPDAGAIFHCYSEDAEYAKKCLDANMNVWFSFAGNLTYRNARNLHETVLNVPIDRILIETESPFMIPAEFREKKRTMPAYITSTAYFLADLLEMDIEQLSVQLWKNSCKVFNLPE